MGRSPRPGRQGTVLHNKCMRPRELAALFSPEAVHRQQGQALCLTQEREADHQQDDRRRRNDQPEAGQGGQGVMAPMGAGIDQAPIPQDMFNAAGGGIVAFANNEDQPVSEDMPLTDEEIERLSGRITTPPPRFLKDRAAKEAAAAEFFCQWTNKEREEAEREIEKKRRKIEKIGKEF